MRTVVAPRSWTAAATRAKSSVRSASRRSASGCSRISARKRSPTLASCVSARASEGDTADALDEDALDLELVRQDDEVSGRAHGEPAHGWQSKHARRHLGRRLDRFLERGAERMEVANRLDHRQRAARKRSPGAACDSVHDLDLETAQAV